MVVQELTYPPLKSICLLVGNKPKYGEFNSITEFSYEYENCVNVEWSVFENFNKSLIEKYGKIKTKYSWDNTENRLHPSANEDEINEYCKMVTVSFYEVVDVDVDMSSWRDSQINSIVDN